MINKKSDVKAKQAYCEELLKNGFEEAKIVSSPADICATKDGKVWYFEIKMTRNTDVYYGAATETEWKQALKDPKHFRFVIAQTDQNNSSFNFFEFTPEEFMKGCTIPPFKIYFNVDMVKKKMLDKSGSKRATIFSEERFKKIHDAYDSLRNNP